MKGECHENQVKEFYMMKIKYYLLFLMLAILALMLMGAAANLSLKASGIGFIPGVKRLVSLETEEDRGFDPAYGGDNGFVVNPYQTDNLDRNQALIIGASVSYILKEVKVFTMFAVALATTALIIFVIIAYIILNRMVRTIVKEKEPRKNDEYVNVSDSCNKEIIDCLGDRNLNAAFLSRNIDEMLADIDKVMEKSKKKWSILL